MAQQGYSDGRPEEAPENPLPTPIGYEAATVTKSARVWTSVLLAVLVLAIAASVVASTYWYQSYGMDLAQIIVFVGYFLASRGQRTSIFWVNMALMFVLAMLNLLYGISNQPLAGAHSVMSHWDPYVPTWPVFVIPYLGLYVMIFFTQGFFAYRLLHRQVRTYLVAMSIAMSVALGTFVLFQTHVPTGALDAPYYDSVFGAILRYVNEDLYGGNYYSTFPSMHCGYATVIAIAWYRRRKPLWSTLAIALSVAIVIATQVLHEHYLIDAVYGIIVGTAAYAVSWFWLEFRPGIKRATFAQPA